MHRQHPNMNTRPGPPCRREHSHVGLLLGLFAAQKGLVLRAWPRLWQRSSPCLEPRPIRERTPDPSRVPKLRVTKPSKKGSGEAWVNCGADRGGHDGGTRAVDADRARGLPAQTVRAAIRADGPHRPAARTGRGDHRQTLTDRLTDRHSPTDTHRKTPTDRHSQTGNRRHSRADVRRQALTDRHSQSDIHRLRSTGR